MLAKRVEASISGRTFAAALQTDLARANLKLTVGEFLILQVAAAAGRRHAGVAHLGRDRSSACIFGALGWFIPKIWLGRRQAGRLKAFNNQLADTIALMSNSLRSGMSLVQSMEMISREAEPPISDEFQRVVREIGLGVGPQEALLHLVRRVDSDDLELLVTAILVQFEIGGNLSRILDSIAGTIRERVKLKGEIRTMSAQGRMAGYILSGMPVAHRRHADADRAVVHGRAVHAWAVAGAASAGARSASSWARWSFASSSRSRSEVPPSCCSPFSPSLGLVLLVVGMYLPRTRQETSSPSAWPRSTSARAASKRSSCSSRSPNACCDRSSASSPSAEPLPQARSKNPKDHAGQAASRRSSASWRWPAIRTAGRRPTTWA